MRKKVRIFLSCMVLGLMLCGCREVDFLGEIPRDYAMAPAETPGEEEGKGSSAADAAGSSEESEDNGSDTDQEAEDPAVSFLDERASVYAYNRLTDMEQIWYRDIEEILGTFEAERKISRVCLENGMDDSDIDRIFQYVLIDHPELFYVDGYSYVKYTRGEKITSILFSGSYSMDYDTAVERRAEIEEAADEILAQTAADASDYEKVKYVYETLIRNTEYQLNSPDDQNIYSVFINHISVCQGYAKATQYLLNRLGVECSLVLGTVDTGDVHAWNLVKLDDSYYYVDTTWGDASYQMVDSVENASGYNLPEINYDYLCVTTEELLRTHTIGGQLPMPLCTATENNYYAQEDALFSWYDRERMGELFRKTMEQGRKDVTIKCTDAAGYQVISEALINDQEIFDYLPEKEGKVAYVQNDNQLSLTFWVTNE